MSSQGKKSTKFCSTKVTTTAMIDDVTTVHVLNESEAKADCASERLRKRVAMFYAQNSH